MRRHGQIVAQRVGHFNECFASGGDYGAGHQNSVHRSDPRREYCGNVDGFDRVDHVGGLVYRANCRRNGQDRSDQHCQPKPFRRSHGYNCRQLGPAIGGDFGYGVACYSFVRCQRHAAIWCCGSGHILKHLRYLEGSAGHDHFGRRLHRSGKGRNGHSDRDQCCRCH
jgi:hypothetical protein